jgi:hypothetical protein
LLVGAGAISKFIFGTTKEIQMPANNPNPSNPFPKGKKSNAGRKPGVPNKFTAELKEAFLQAASNAGFVMEVPRLDAEGKEIGRELIAGEGGLVGYLTWAAINRSNAFMAQLGRFIPAELNARFDRRSLNVNADVRYRTVEEIDADLRAVGYSDEKIASLIEDLRPQSLSVINGVEPEKPAAKPETGGGDYLDEDGVLRNAKGEPVAACVGRCRGMRM